MMERYSSMCSSESYTTALNTCALKSGGFRFSRVFSSAFDPFPLLPLASWPSRRSESSRDIPLSTVNMVLQIFNESLEETINPADLLSKQEALMKTAGRDMGKKKRTNRSAKLKQYKLDARREQWLSQVKNKGVKAVSGGSSLLTERGSSPKNSDSLRDGIEESHDSDFELSMNIPPINVQGNGITGSRPDRPARSSSSSSGSSLSGSTGMSDDDGDTCFDDWEAVADALGTDALQKKPSVNPSSGGSIDLNSITGDTKLEKNSPCFSTEVASTGVLRADYRGKLKCFESNRVERAISCRAWRADDALRPPSLPTLSKQMSLPSERHHSRGPLICGRTGVNSSTLLSCPICYEDLDLTDSSFLPCSCGFHLCLFCHKQILEVDGRCPGCRKKYRPLDEDIKEHPPVMCLSRSCSVRLRI